MWGGIPKNQIIGITIISRLNAIQCDNYNFGKINSVTLWTTYTYKNVNKFGSGKAVPVVTVHQLFFNEMVCYITRFIASGQLWCYFKQQVAISRHSLFGENHLMCHNLQNLETT